MTPQSRMDPDMAAARARTEAAAAQHPPVVPQPPMEPQRAVNDLLNMMWVAGGPAMAASGDRWVAARGRRILCRMHRPVEAANLPVLVWFHGGGWVWSSVDTHDRLCRELAASGEVAVISVDYALSPEAKFPQALLECAEVVRQIAAEAASWGVDPARMLVGGDSAGGNLAFGTALYLRDHGGPLLVGVHGFYPVTDADFETDGYREFDQGYGLTRASMQMYWELYLRDAADRANPYAAPLRGDLAGLPPCLIQIAELDVLRDDGRLLAAKLRAAGVATTEIAYPGVLHGFARLTGAVEKSRVAVAEAGAWIRKTA